MADKKYSVILEKVGNQPLMTTKILCGELGLGLAKAKGMVDKVPFTIATDLESAMTAPFLWNTVMRVNGRIAKRTDTASGSFLRNMLTVLLKSIMIGYDYAKELEFGAFEDQKIGFVINDRFVGDIIIIASDGEEFDDGGTKFTV